jgi:hypothetical protein
MKAFTRSLILRCFIEVTAGALSYGVGSMRLPEIFGMKSKRSLMGAIPRRQDSCRLSDFSSADHVICAFPR